MRTNYLAIASGTIIGCLMLTPAMVDADDAKSAPTVKGISLQLALEGAQAALAACMDIKFGGATVTVLDATTEPLVMLRQEGSPKPTAEVSRRKAYTALKTGMSSGEFGKSVNFKPGAAARTPAADGMGPNPNFDPLDLPVWNNDPLLVPYGGGLLIKANGKVVGAIGLSGAPPKDEACAIAGQQYIENKLR